LSGNLRTVVDQASALIARELLPFIGTLSFVTKVWYSSDGLYCNSWCPVIRSAVSSSSLSKFSKNFNVSCKPEGMVDTILGGNLLNMQGRMTLHISLEFKS
jgi:hypothetical protein